MIHKVQETRTRYQIKGKRDKTPHTTYEIDGTRYKIRDTSHKTLDTSHETHDTATNEHIDNELKEKRMDLISKVET